MRRSSKNCQRKKNDLRDEFPKQPQSILSIAASSKRTGIKKDGAITRLFIPSNEYDFEGEIIIYGDYIIFRHIGEPYRGVMIQDEIISKMVQCLFDHAFNDFKNKVSRS